MDMTRSESSKASSSLSSLVCSRSDLFAFQMTSIWAILACGCLGLMAWYGPDRVSQSSLPARRLRGYHWAGEWLCAVNFTFQVWDFFVSLFIPEHATSIMLTHHTLAAVVSFCGLYYESLHYYAVFFLGLSEVSSIFLVFVDLSKYFPPVPGTWYDIWVQSVCGPLFVVTFLYFRVVRWWPLSWQLWQDTQRAPPSWLNRLFVGINLPLGILQLYWSTLILEEVYKVVVVGQEATQEVLQDVN